MVADGDSNSAFSGAPVVFDAALDVLSDWGSDNAWLSRLPTPPASPTATVDSSQENVKKPTSYRRKRNARDAERSALQAQIEALTRALETEKRRFPERTETLTGDAQALSREWKAMAARQRRLRHAAEDDHATLVNAWESQRRTARAIQKLLQKALVIGRPLMRTSETVTIADFRGPTLDVPTHMAYLDRLQGQAPLITASRVVSTGLLVPGEPFCTVRCRDVGVEGMQIEFIAERALPFDAASVADAVWTEITRMEHDGRLVDYEHTMRTSTALVSSFVSAPNGQNLTGSNHGQVVEGTTHGQTALRRFAPEPDGTIWLVAMNHARILGEIGKTNGYLHGDGWISIEPTNSEKICRVKWYHRMHGRPQGIETSSQDERARWAYSAVSKPMRLQWELTFERTLQAIENALVLHKIDTGGH